MAAIKTAIQIVDGMTPALKSMNTALSILNNSFESVQHTSANAMDTSDFIVARQQIAAASVAIDNMENYLQKSAAAQQSLNNKMKEGRSVAESLVGKVAGIMAAYASWETAMGIVSAADEYTGISSRLDLINDGLQTTKELQEMVRASANSTYSNYKDTADMVGKLGIQAGDAFANNQDILNFAEQINKHLAIAGTNGAAAQGAMIQMTQAMSNGVLRGEELNSVMDGMPTVAKTIEKYFHKMGDTRGIKQIAEDGLITSDIVKAALYSAADETDAKFKNMGVTFAGVWNLFKNKADEAMTPVYENLKQLTNSANFQNFAIQAGQAVATVANVLVWAFDLISTIGAFAANNWGLIEPIIWGVTAAFGAYNAVLLYNNTLQGISTARKAANALLTSILNAKIMLATGATFAQTTAQWGLNAALLACPITWIIAGIIAFITVVYAVIQAVLDMQDSTYSAFDVIKGTVAAAGAFIYNAFIGALEAIMQFLYTSFAYPFVGIIEFVLNVCNGGFNSFGDAVKNLLGQIIGWFLNLGKVVSRIIDAIFGTDWTAGLNSLEDSVLAWGKNDKAVTLNKNFEGVQRLEYGKSYEWGRDLNFGTDELKKNAVNNPKMQTAAEMMASAGLNGTANKIARNTAKTARNTASMSDSIAGTDEEIKYLREIGEREAINRFTTAEIKIDMKNDNHISNGLGLDEVIDGLTERVQTAMKIAAEGVHK